MLNRRRWIRAIGIAGLISLSSAAAGVGQPRVNLHAATLADFTTRIQGYLALQKKLTAALPPLKRTGDAAEISSREIALGDAIRAGRAEAGPGDIFTRDVAHVFRQVLKSDYWRRSLRGKAMVRDEIPHFRPKINQTYSSEWQLAMFPAPLLAALPVLPDGLEYRLLSDALILRDVKANIIVDFILDVF